MPEYIDFKAPCGHMVRVNNPLSTDWGLASCATVINGNICGKLVNRRFVEPKKPEIVAELTETDILLLKDMKIGL
jgi:hypothetical protein